MAFCRVQYLSNPNLRSQTQKLPFLLHLLPYQSFPNLPTSDKPMTTLVEPTLNWTSTSVLSRRIKRCRVWVYLTFPLLRSKVNTRSTLDHSRDRKPLPRIGVAYIPALGRRWGDLSAGVTRDPPSTSRVRDSCLCTYGYQKTKDRDNQVLNWGSC